MVEIGVIVFFLVLFFHGQKNVSSISYRLRLWPFGAAIVCSSGGGEFPFSSFQPQRQLERAFCWNSGWRTSIGSVKTCFRLVWFVGFLPWPRMACKSMEGLKQRASRKKLQWRTGPSNVFTWDTPAISDQRIVVHVSYDSFWGGEPVDYQAVFGIECFVLKDQSELSWFSSGFSW